jgi:hypothetical protein
MARPSKEGNGGWVLEGGYYLSSLLLCLDTVFSFVSGVLTGYLRITFY